MDIQHRQHRRTAALLVALALTLGLMAATATPVVAQERTIEGEGDAAKVRLTDEDNANRIDRAVLGLLLVAVVMAVLTLLFWWHTQPTRRARVLAARAGPAAFDDGDFDG